MTGGTLANGVMVRRPLKRSGLIMKMPGSVVNVSEQIQLSRRRNNLTFSHHREVCPAEDEAMQDRLLDWAETEKATVKAFRH